MWRLMALRFIAWRCRCRRSRSHGLHRWIADWIMETEKREEFLTAKQLAAILQVSESTVRRLAAKRRIPSVRLTPRIIRSHLDAVRQSLEVPRHRIRHGEYTERIDDAQLTFDDLLLT